MERKNTDETGTFLAEKMLFQEQYSLFLFRFNFFFCFLFKTAVLFH